MFKVGDTVVLAKNPFDEQIPYMMDKYLEQKDKPQKVIKVKKVNFLGTSGQWIWTELNNDWIDKAWFKKWKTQRKS